MANKKKIYETCENCNGEGTVMVAKLYPNGHTEVNEKCPECDGDGEILVSESDKLIAEAKRRYPIGTKFNPAHIGSNNFICIVTNDNFMFDEPDVFSLTDDNHRWSEDEKYGDTHYNRCVYCDGVWANIVDEEELQKKKLLKEAKNRYPIGTKFVPVHVDKNDSEYCIVTEDNFKFEGGTLYSMLGNSYWDYHKNPKNGNTGSNRIVYRYGEWARIISDEKPTDESIEEVQKSIDELVEEAKKRFPVGSEVSTVNLGRECVFEVTTNTFYKYLNMIMVKTHSGDYTVYVNGKWAEVITKITSPLEICMQKYKKGMKVRTPDCNSGFSNMVFTIQVDPLNFRDLHNGNVDYKGSGGWLYHGGKYAEILEDAPIQTNKEDAPIQTNKEDAPIQTKKEDKKLLVDDVQSVSINLSTKKKKITFKI
jgi:hypothetical protein